VEQLQIGENVKTSNFYDIIMT